MIILRIIYKILLFIVTIAGFILVSLLGRLSSSDIQKRRKLYVKIVHFYCKLALWLMNFKVHVKGLPESNQNFLKVGNHLGMLDILVVASLRPTLFVTSVEMKNTPFLGLLSELGGCLYVERRDRSNIHSEMQEIRQALKDGFNVVLYPEGRCGDGESVLPFKKTLLTSAAGTGVPVLPMVVNYSKVNGEPISLKWRDHVCWYGETQFASALLKVLSLSSVEVEFEFSEPMWIQTEEERSDFALRIQKAVESKYRPIR